MKQHSSLNGIKNNVSEDQALRQVLGGDLELACVVDIAKRTGVSPTELVRHMVREFYGVQFDVTPSHLRWAMQQSASDAAKWPVQA